MHNIIIETISTTTRRTYTAGTSTEEHKKLLAEGYTFDYRAGQYRRTVKDTMVFDGVAGTLAA